MSYLNAMRDQEALVPSSEFAKHGGDAASFLRWSSDPLDPDEADDEIVVTSVRRLLRVAVAAADAGARFAHEEAEMDPAAWMIAPRVLFGGRPAIEACQDLDGFCRSIVLHGLRLGMDADPEAVDALLSDDGSDENAAYDLDEDGPVVNDADDIRLPGPLLLTCWIGCGLPADRLFAFCGLVTDRPADLVERVIARYGAAAAAKAEFQVGFDGTTAMATAMISAAMANTLALASRDPECPLARGLDVAVEQRFAA